MEASRIAELYPDWRDAVNQRLDQIYCITIDDAGVSEEHLIDHWQSNEAPFDFVEWFGSKYDLDPIPSVAPTLKREN
jgi:hypothetical protein